MKLACKPKHLFNFTSLLLILNIVVPLFPSLAQSPDADSTAYQAQRLKVNALLAQRSAKFGQYDQSLNQRTGIFGFQSKQDVKNSNEILRQIVINDNNIFKELKILLDYKEQVVQQARRDASNNSDRVRNYQNTIKKLQEENEQLKSSQQGIRTQRAIAVCASILLLAGLFIVLYRKRKQTSL